jgi:hypothetical protein
MHAAFYLYDIKFCLTTCTLTAAPLATQAELQLSQRKLAFLSAQLNSS